MDREVSECIGFLFVKHFSYFPNGRISLSAYRRKKTLVCYVNTIIVVITLECDNGSDAYIGILRIVEILVALHSVSTDLSVRVWMSDEHSPLGLR